MRHARPGFYPVERRTDLYRIESYRHDGVVKLGQTYGETLATPTRPGTRAAIVGLSPVEVQLSRGFPFPPLCSPS